MSVSVQTEVDLNLKLHEKAEGIYEPPLKLTVEIESRDGNLPKDGTFIDPDDFRNCLFDAIKDLQNEYIGNVKGLAYIPHTLEMIISRIWERIQTTLPYQVKLTALTLRKDDIFVVKYNIDNFVREPQPQLKYKPKAKSRK